MSEKETRIVPAHKVFLEMERRDEDQILAELRGKVVEEYVYRVEGRLGISYAGINEICYRMKHIHVEPWVMWDEDEKYYYATVRAINTVEDISALGLGQQPKLMKVYDRDPRGRRLETSHLEEDRFAKTKALSKAQRNAKKAVIPLTTIKVFIDKFQKGTKRPPKPVKAREKAVVKAKFPPLTSPAIREKSIKPEGRLSKDDVQKALAAEGIPVEKLDFEETDSSIVVSKNVEWMDIKVVNRVTRILQKYGGNYYAEQGAWDVPRR